MPIKQDHSKRRGRKPTTACLEFKLLEVDSQAFGFYHPSVADVQRNGDIGPGHLHRFAKVRKQVIAGIRQKAREVN